MSEKIDRSVCGRPGRKPSIAAARPPRRSVKSAAVNPRTGLSLMSRTEK